MRLLKSAVGAVIAVVVFGALPASAQSVIACNWDQFWLDNSQTYRITGDTWEQFNEESWAWGPMTCSTYMAMPSHCSATTSNATYSHTAQSRRADAYGERSYELAIAIDRQSGAASWTRSGQSIYFDSPELNRSIRERHRPGF